jgi:hypothetical protein
VAVFDGVVDQVDQAAADRQRPAHQRHRRAAAQFHLLADVGGIAADAVEQRVEVERLHGFRRIHAARQVQPFLDHLLHGRQVVDQALLQFGS